MNYNLGQDEFKNWIFEESNFSADALGKCESIMCLGNGYMGIRSATEEKYLNEIRDTFISGTFNKFDEHEVTELPNVADVTNIDIRIDGERFSLEFGAIKEYSRYLNLKIAELSRSIIWISPKGKEVKFIFKRFVSLENLHLISMKLEVTPINCEIDFEMNSGINAQMSNTGAQHFHEGDKRIYDKKYVQLIQTTTESNIDFVITTVHNVKVDNGILEDAVMNMDRRKVWLTYKVNLKDGQTLEAEKITNIFTSRDKEFENKTLDELKEIAVNNLRKESNKGYTKLLEEHKEKWEKDIWNNYNFELDSKNDFDILAIRFAIYHLTVMTPGHDSRMGIGAKGLSGEGYKGHSFWDTEIFILPFFIYSNPKVARSLLEYRYKGLEGARKKAKENGYEGAMYPWEAAWPTDGEVTPVWGAVDIVTGKQTKIWSGFIEQHISSDISNAVWQYYMITGDEEFMNKYGYEILFDTARFWISRLEWNEDKKEYHINDVIGPDEYKEHVNNNAFTNYMAKHNIDLAMEYCDKLRNSNMCLYNKLNEKLNIKRSMELWKDRVDKIYIPEPNEKGIISQDDTYLTKKIIDLTKYKNQDKVGTIFVDYNLEQVNEIQVSKQADIMILFYLLENKFSKDIKKKNYDYYESKTLHDSSLSLSTHCILANDLGNYTLAYDLFRRATEIDLGPAMNTSDHGIHAASLGGIWQCVVMGFAGVRMLGGNLRVNPKLPEEWDRLKFPIHWKGDLLEIKITKESLYIKSNGDKNVTLTVFDKEYTFYKELKIVLN
ncbi:glycoside hydrolase family 65 protein [Clostridium perfringens]|nr:glycoside hydrolase family 65 protein [Clostridium perfringens]